MPLNITNTISPHQFLSVEPSSCNEWIPFWGHHQPTLIENLTTLCKLCRELLLPVISVTPCTSRGAPPAMQTLCLSEASAALGVFHSRLCKSNSVWRFGRNDRMNFWSPLMKRKHIRKEHTTPQGGALWPACSYRAGLHGTTALSLVFPYTKEHTW